DLLVVDLGRATPHHDFSRPVLAHIDAIESLFQKRDGYGRRIDLEIDWVVARSIARVNDLKLAAIEALDAESGRADGERELCGAGRELSNLEVGAVIEPDNVAAGELDFGAPVRAGVDLVILVKRHVDRGVEPGVTRVIRSLIADIALD